MDSSVAPLPRASAAERQYRWAQAAQKASGEAIGETRGIRRQKWRLAATADVRHRGVVLALSGAVGCVAGENGIGIETGYFRRPAVTVTAVVLDADTRKPLKGVYGILVEEGVGEVSRDEQTDADGRLVVPGCVSRRSRPGWRRPWDRGTCRSSRWAASSTPPPICVRRADGRIALVDFGAARDGARADPGARAGHDREPLAGARRYRSSTGSPGRIVPVASTRA